MQNHSAPSRIRLAIAGVGNCASALVQGLTYYSKRADTESGLITPLIGDYRIEDIVVVAAFDIDRRKVGLNLEQAIFNAPNCALIFEPEPKQSKVLVQMGPVLDGIPEHMARVQEGEAFQVAHASPVNIAQMLKDAQADVLVCYMPVGADSAVRHYAQACIDAKVAFVNAVPTFIASDPVWAERFRQAGIPTIGDDVKSQVGATILHRSIVHLLAERGCSVTRTYQLNFGGNADFLNMLDRNRLHSKKRSKTAAVTAELPRGFDPDNVHVGPSDYVRSLRDQKIAYIHVDGVGFGGVEIDIEVKLTVQDSPNSAAVVIDAIRCAKLALDRGIAGPVDAVCAYYMKSPPVQITDSEGKNRLDEFIQ